jgi:hypothetical protein
MEELQIMESKTGEAYLIEELKTVHGRLVSVISSAQLGKGYSDAELELIESRLVETVVNAGSGSATLQLCLEVANSLGRFGTPQIQESALQLMDLIMSAAAFKNSEELQTKAFGYLRYFAEATHPSFKPLNGPAQEFIFELLDSFFAAIRAKAGHYFLDTRVSAKIRGNESQLIGLVQGFSTLFLEDASFGTEAHSLFLDQFAYKKLEADWKRFSKLDHAVRQVLAAFAQSKNENLAALSAKTLLKLATQFEHQGPPERQDDIVERVIQIEQWQAILAALSGEKIRVSLEKTKSHLDELKKQLEGRL